MAKNNENAAKILDYWFALDFLSQDKYPDYVEIRNKIKRHKEDWAKGKSKYKTIETFIRLEKKDIATRQLYDEIYEEAKSCGMKKWGNLTVYIGRVKREKCIECISNILSLPSEADNRVEKSSERIAWASLQLSPEGKYIEHSLSLSTILWALDEIKVSKEKLSEALDNQEYTLAVETLENRFFDKDKRAEVESEKKLDTNKVNIAWKLRCEELRASSEKDILKLTQQLSFATEKVETCEDILGEIRQNIEDKQEKKKKTHDLIKQLLEEEFSKRNSVWIFTKLFNKEKYNVAMQLADEYKKDADKQRKIELELEQDLEQLKKNEQQKEEIVAIARKEVDELEQKIDNINEPMRVAEKNKSDAEIESQRTEQQYQNQKMKIETKRAILSKASDVDEMVILDEKFMLDYDQKRIGTVHTFQGKEANEVIFLLGCDNSREAEGAIKWVNKNIVNVAATRAKFRLYVIGDEAAWNKSPCVSEAKRIMDIYAIKEIKNIIEKGLPDEEKKKALLNASNALPSVTQFMTIKTEGKERILDYRFDTTNLIQGLTKEFIKNDLSKEQLEKFGFKSMKDLEMLSQSVRANVVLGMKLFYLLEPVYKINHDMDASCCAILFCKAMELQMKDCFIKGLKTVLPEFEIKGFGKGRTKVTLKDAENKELTLGTFVMIIRSNRETLGQHMQNIGNTDYDQVWWRLFDERLSECTIRRNKCCHSGVFNWKELSYLLYDMFKKHEKKNIGGVIFESMVGTKL